MDCQGDGLYHVTENGLWVLSANLTASTVVASPVMCSKLEEVVLLDGVGSVMKVGVTLNFRS